MIAGGRDALERAVEGAEDDEQAGEADVRMLGLSARDVVVGVTASGQTPYVQGALRAAQASGCLTGVVVCNGAAPVCEMAEIAVVVEPGPEVIAGSTRLKAGTAQKLVLNMISTLIMVRLGRTMGNKMIGVRPTNAKLRARSISLVRDLTSSSEEEAETALICADWDVPLATLSLHLGSAHAAQHALAESGMNIAEAMAKAGLRPT
jgi:N-acetylmuramic acid 6-phosphate etherase